MADGYLIAKRAFQRLRLSGQTWAEGPTREAEPWHFSAVAEALRQPSKKLVKHLQTAELSTLRGPRLSVVQTIGLGLFTCVATLTLVALGAFWSALRPAVGERLWTIATAGFLLLAAALLIRRLFVLARGDDCPAWLAAVVNWIGKGRSLTTALPLLLASRFRRRASRAFLRAGRLKRAGIEPVATKKRRRRAASSDDGIEETAAKAA
jgi:hypothetical protein